METLRPEIEPAGEAQIIAQGVPPPSGEGVAEDDFADAALSVLGLYSAVLSQWHGEALEPDALSRTVPDSQAWQHVEQLTEAARSAESGPRGMFVLRDFEVGVFASDLLQVDFCLDQSETTPGEQDAGAVADLAEARPGDADAEVLWTGVGMRRSDDREWRAFSITHRAVGGDGEHHCAQGL